MYAAALFLCMLSGYTQAKLQDIRKDVTPDGLDELPAVGSVVVVPTLPSDQAVSSAEGVTVYTFQLILHLLF